MLGAKLVADGGYLEQIWCDFGGVGGSMHGFAGYSEGLEISEAKLGADGEVVVGGCVWQC